MQFSPGQKYGNKVFLLTEMRYYFKLPWNFECQWLIKNKEVEYSILFKSESLST